MPNHEQVKANYRHGHLLKAITSGIARIGKTPETVTVEDLAPVDEFHIGGRRASVDFLDQLGLTDGDHILDIGCGLGGTSRFIADRYRSRVTGIDLTPEYIETGKALCTWVGLDDRIALHQGNALSLAFEGNTFDGACMLHVGMNIDNKAGLFSEVFRVLRPGALFGIYDVMQIGKGELTYPFPWATRPSESAIATPEHYIKGLKAAGFTLVAERNRHEFAMAVFEQMRSKAKTSKEPSPLGIQTLLGESTPFRVKNMIENIMAGRIAPVELIVRKKHP